MQPSQTPRLRGVLAPVLTPFHDTLEPDSARFITHCRWLIECGVSLAIFGTNSEAASLGIGERLQLTDTLLDAGIPAARLMPGTGACSISDAVVLSQHAVRNGAAGVLVLPPFFYKGVSEEGLFAYYSELVERVADDRLAIYLYHIPQLTQVPITLSLIERLLRRYPRAIAGAKDSSGDWNNSLAMLDAFAKDGFDVFPASEAMLSRAMPLGAAGCISATANVNPLGITKLYDMWRSPDASTLQVRVDLIRAIFQARPMIAAMKRVVAEHAGHAQWRNVRPPLTAMDEPVAGELLAELRACGFAMPGYPRG